MEANLVSEEIVAPQSDFATKHESYLDAKRSSPLFEGLSKYQHIERLGHKEVEGLLDGTVVVQEKIDGANATVAWRDGRIIIASRNNAISVDGTPPDGFRGLVQYVLAHQGLRTLAADYDVRGEWLVTHSLPYPKEVLMQFYVFDLQRRDGSYVDPDVYEPMCYALGVQYVPSTKLHRPTFDQLVDVVKSPSGFRAEHREGIVIKRYDFVNQYGRTQFGKMIHEDFKVKNAVTFGAKNDDPDEVKIVAQLITPFEIKKTIAKVATNRGEDETVRHMAEVLGRVYDDLLREELADYLRKNRRAKIDFGALQKLVTMKTRDIALAHYNGIPTMFGEEMRDYLADTKRDSA